jgi:hypothetical protein
MSGRLQNQLLRQVFLTPGFDFKGDIDLQIFTGLL